MRDVWFAPTKYSRPCFYRGPVLSGLMSSACGAWRSKVTLSEAVENPTEGLALDFQVCSKCAALTGVKTKPGAKVSPTKRGLFTKEERAALLAEV
jgi:hypothetical protein